MSDERNHEATPRQRRRFRERGEIARSRDLTGAAVLLAALAAVLIVAAAGANPVALFAAQIFGHLGHPLAGDLAPRFATTFARGAAPVLIACLAAALGVGLLQNRGAPSFESLRLDVTRLNPLPKLKQMLGSPEALLGLATSFIKVGVVATVCIVTIRQKAPAVLGAGPAPLGTAFGNATELVLSLVLRTLGAMLVLGLADFGLSWVKLERKMRMSTQQLRDDMKEEEGDPQVRARRRRRALELSRQRSLNDVPKADVVLVNPTHYAVALRYQSDRNNAPRVVAKGADARAARIRAIARKNGVPVVPQPPLCRELYRRVKVGKEIPADLYQAVAVILSYVYRLKGRTA